MKHARLMTAMGFSMLLAMSTACGGDDEGDGTDPVVDSGPSAADGATDAIDGAPTGGGTQEIGQFCDTLPEGGPSCVDGLSCCADNVCREPDDCAGSSGYVPCTQASDCGGKVCCETPSMTFCTKKSACTSYGGTELP
jgi:hypothetical protein